MALSAGSRLGPFEILTLVGAGGMGEVYQARDARLDRQLTFALQGTRLQARYQFGLLSGESQVEMTPGFVKLTDFTSFQDEIRMIDNDTMIGKWVSPDLPSPLADSLRNYLEPGSNQLAFYYILSRVKG